MNSDETSWRSRLAIGVLVVAGDQRRERQRDAEHQGPEQAAAHGAIRSRRGRADARQPRRQFGHDAAALGALMAVQRAISSRVRPQPRQRPDARIERADFDAGGFDGGHDRSRGVNSVGEHKVRGRERNRAIVASSGPGAEQRPAAEALASLPASGRSRPAARSAAHSIGAIAATTRSGGKVTTTSVPMRSLDLSAKVPPCRSTRLLAIGRPRPAPCSADLIEFEPWPNDASTIGISSSGMPGPVSLTLMYWPPDAVQPTLSQISPPCGVNLIAFDRRLRQIWRTARSSAQMPRQIGLEHFVDGDAAVGGAQLEQVVAILDDADQRDRLLVELVAAGLDAREIENLVDQAEQVHAGIMDVGRNIPCRPAPRARRTLRSS